MKISEIPNPLFNDAEDPSVDLSGLKSETVYNSRRENKRKFKKLLSKQNAADAIIGFSREVDVFGFTKGQFSLIELIEEAIKKTGPAHLTISTWTAKTADLRDVLTFLDKGHILSARFLIDYSFQRRQPEVAQAIRNKFGAGSVKVSQNHAKFFMLENKDGWNVVCKTSMNLNTNPRFEDFDLSNDLGLFEFMKTMVDEIFNKGIKNGKETGSDVWREFKG